jgi:hypothetical protein
MLIFNMALNFMFICNPEKLQMWQSKLSTYSCFHPTHIFLVTCYLKFPFAHPIGYNARITHTLISKDKKTKRLHLHLILHAKDSTLNYNNIFKNKRIHTTMNITCITHHCSWFSICETNFQEQNSISNSTSKKITTKEHGKTMLLHSLYLKDL